MTKRAGNFLYYNRLVQELTGSLNKPNELAVAPQAVRRYHRSFCFFVFPILTAIFFGACDNYNLSLTEFFSEVPGMIGVYPGGGDSLPPLFTSLADFAAYLAAVPNGGSPADPVAARLELSLADSGNGWMALLAVLDGQPKYVSLDFSTSSMTDISPPGEFNPGAVNIGKSMVVSLTLPDEATSIADGTYSDPTFRDFTNLKSVSGDGITDVGNNTFLNRAALTSVDFPAATNIGYNAFQNCGALTTVKLPAATDIGSLAFAGCFSLTTVSLPEVEFITSNAFFSCGSLTTVNLPEVEIIGACAFLGCSNLTSLTLGQEIAPYLDVNVFENTGPSGTLTIHVPAGTVSDYISVSAWNVLVNPTPANGDTAAYGPNHKGIIITDTP
jgi:hypothetical protein